MKFMNEKTVHLLLCNLLAECTVHFEQYIDNTINANKIRKYAFQGKIRIPHKKAPQLVRMHGFITAKTDEAGSDTIVDCEGITYLDAWDLAEGLVLINGCIRLLCIEGRIRVKIEGTVRLIDCQDFETGGVLDTEILYDEEDPQRMYLGTLVKDSYLNIGKHFHLQGGTIRFEFCSKPHETDQPLPYHLDEMDELLFQCTDPIPLGAMHIVGIGSDPVTMSININALSPGNVRTSIFLFPARILFSVVGENTMLFLSGDRKDGIIEMNVGGEWSNFISSSPHVHLVNPRDPTGPSLIEGGGLFTGKLDCTGLSLPRLSLSSPLTNAKAFPQSKWPQELPAQKISFSVSEIGKPNFIIKFNPISIDGFLISNAKGKDESLHASLNERGFSFNSGYLVARESSNQAPRKVPAFIIDNKCRVWVEVSGTAIEMRDWFIQNGPP